MDYIHEIEKHLSIKAKCIMMKIQPGDVSETHSDTSFLEKYINFKPSTSINKGIKEFVDWYKDYYNHYIYFNL